MISTINSPYDSPATEWFEAEAAAAALASLPWPWPHLTWEPMPSTRCSSIEARASLIICVLKYVKILRARTVIYLIGDDTAFFKASRISHKLNHTALIGSCGNIEGDF